MDCQTRVRFVQINTFKSITSQLFSEARVLRKLDLEATLLLSGNNEVEHMGSGERSRDCCSHVAHLLRSSDHKNHTDSSLDLGVMQVLPDRGNTDYNSEIITLTGLCGSRYHG